METKCVAYTFDKSQMTCILHASIEKGTTRKRKTQSGVKKADYILSLPEMNLCSNKNRQKRCKREPKCRHVNCLRNGQKQHAQEFRNSNTLFCNAKKCSKKECCE